MIRFPGVYSRRDSKVYQFALKAPKDLRHHFPGSWAQRVIKRQFGLLKVRFRGLDKNTAHVVTLFALSNLWMARRRLMAMAAVRPQSV